MANSIISNININPDPFYILIPNANPAPTINIDYKYNSGGWDSAEMTEQIRNSKGEIVYDFYKDKKNTIAIPDPFNWNTFSHTWDGIANVGAGAGAYVTDGTYTFYIVSHVNTAPDSQASKTFFLEKAVVPALKSILNPTNTYYNKNSSFPINYSLEKGSGIPPIIRLKIQQGSLEQSPQIVSVINNNISNDGSYAITWDGTLNNVAAPAGDYSYSLEATTFINNYPAQSNVISGNFKLINAEAPTPTITNLSADSNPYDPSKGLIVFSYTLKGSLGYSAISASIYNQNQPDKTIKTWNFNNQSSGTNTITWDGKDTNGTILPGGTYIFKVWGKDGTYEIIPNQSTLTIVNSTPSPSPVPNPSPTQTPNPPPSPNPNLNQNSNPNPPASPNSPKDTGANQPPSLPSAASKITNNCAGFVDIDANDKNCFAYKYTKSIGAIMGFADGNFRQNSYLQRDQAAKIALIAFQRFVNNTDYCKGKKPFIDIDSTSWSRQFICHGAALGVIKGYSAGLDKGHFRPERIVNRVEYLSLILRNLKDKMPDLKSVSYLDVKKDLWYTGFSKFAFDHNLFDTSIKLNPSAQITRGEASQILYKLHQQGIL